MLECLIYLELSLEVKVVNCDDDMDGRETDMQGSGWRFADGLMARLWSVVIVHNLLFLALSLSPAGPFYMHSLSNRSDDCTLVDESVRLIDNKLK